MSQNNEKSKISNTKNNTKPIVILLVLTLITATIFSMYAYSKYKTTLTGNGTATVAKWSFKVNGQTQTIPDIDLTQTMDTHNNVAEGKIAPGTSGHFDLELDATGSEVAIDYNIKLAITEKPTNLKFYLDNTYETEIAETEGILNVSGSIPLETIDTPLIKTIYWQWPYETGTTENEVKENDKTDTIDSAKKVTMTITVTGTQRKPQDEQASNLINELKVGDTINYNPSGTYNWNKEYATSNDTGTQTLSSSTGESFNVSQWKVLSIDKNANKIEIVPATIPSGTVTLQGAQGYNNAVLLLNQACSSLYGNSSKGITARSIKEEDFVKVGGENWTNERATYESKGSIQYGNRTSPYTESRWYPSIYIQENGCLTDGKMPDTAKYGQSQQVSLIKDSANRATVSIQPRQSSYVTTDYATTAKILGEYSKILLQNGESTQYWIATRCIDLYQTYCWFDICRINSGYFSPYGMYYSGGVTLSKSHSICSVLSLSTDILEKTSDGTYNVK